MTTTPPNPPHVCTQIEVLERIEGKLDEILTRLGRGDTAIALLEHRLAFIERIVYGLCGFILLAVLAGIVALVVRGAP
jgi:hypothetical protein